jgi:hypothetical protein
MPLYKFFWLEKNILQLSTSYICRFLLESKRHNLFAMLALCMTASVV